jgi:hypothetical protein
VKATDDRVGIIDGDRSNIGQGLDLGGAGIQLDSHVLPWRGRKGRREEGGEGIR